MTDSLYHIDESANVLCPALYTRLKELVGSVTVANWGEPLTYRAYPRGDGTAYTEVEDGGEYYRINCPYCKYGDKRKRLWISHAYGQKDAAGRRMYFLAHCYNEDCLSLENNWSDLRQRIFGFVNADAQSQRIENTYIVRAPEWDESAAKPEPPGQVVAICDLYKRQPDHNAIRYLQERQYTLEMCQFWNIGYCLSASPQFSLAAGRLIFPVVMNNEFIGWQARFIGTADWKTTPKYYTMRHMKKSRILYGFDHARIFPFVIVVEGPTDAHRVGAPAVSIFGKTVSHFQRQLLMETWRGKPIFLALDPEAREERAQAKQDMEGHNAPVIDIELPPGWDPGSTPHETFWQILRVQAEAAGVRI